MACRGILIGIAMGALVYSAVVVGALVALSADWAWDGKMGF